MRTTTIELEENSFDLHFQNKFLSRLLFLDIYIDFCALVGSNSAHNTHKKNTFFLPHSFIQNIILVNTYHNLNDGRRLRNNDGTVSFFFQF